VNSVKGIEARVKFKIKAPLGGNVSRLVCIPKNGQNADELGAAEVIQAVLEGRGDDYDFRAVDTLFAGLLSKGVMRGVDSGVFTDAITSFPVDCVLDEFQSQAVRALVDNPTNKLFKFIHGPPGLSISISSQRMRQNSGYFYCSAVDC
jgi:hypothetical protein